MDDQYTRMIITKYNDRLFKLTVQKGNPGLIEINGNIISSNNIENIVKAFQTITGFNLNIDNLKNDSDGILKEIERYR